MKPAGSVDRRPIEDPKAVLQQLYSRVGSLSEREVKMLMGLCQEQGNNACLAAAAKRYKELKAQKPP